MQRSLVLGHRGSPRRFPENTLRSFRCALDEGADGVELDTRCSSTGELVVCHDTTLERLSTTHARARVRACSPYALRQYDLGNNNTVPTLDETLHALGTAWINVEIKSDDGDPAQLAFEAAKLLTRPQHKNRKIVVSSFEPLVLEKLQQHAPSMKLGLLLPEHPLHAADVLTRARGLRLWSVHPPYQQCTKEHLRAWKARCLKIFAWTVDAPDTLRMLATLAIDGIISNEPALAARIVREVSE